MRSAAIGIGTIFIIFFMFVSMATISESASIYQEEHTALNEAIYQTGVFLREDAEAVESNSDLKQVFIAFLKPLLQHPEKYEVDFYSIDYKNGLIDVGLKYSYMPWNNKYNLESMEYGKPKIIEARRTVILDDSEEI